PRAGENEHGFPVQIGRDGSLAVHLEHDLGAAGTDLAADADVVVSGRAVKDDAILARAQVDEVAWIGGGGVVAGGAEHGVVAGAVVAEQGVVAVAAIQEIAAWPAGEAVVAESA